MSYTVGDVRRWEVTALGGVAGAVSTRVSAASEARRVLTEGGEELDGGWEGVAADAVLDAVEAEKAHVARLADALEDLVESVRGAQAALGPAVQMVRERIGEAEAAGLVVRDTSVEPAGRVGTSEVADRDPAAVRAAVDLHAEAIGTAVATVRALDQHYGRQIDEIAARLHSAVPGEVDRSAIPAPDDPASGRAVDAMTGAMARGTFALADDLDPLTRGKHTLNPAPDHHGRVASAGLRSLGRVAGPLGGGLTVYDGMKAHAEGETTASEAFLGTTGALTGGTLGGMAGGALLGSAFGPPGTFVGAGIGAVVGTLVGQRAGDTIHERYIDENSQG